MTPAELDALEELAANATAAPWEMNSRGKLPGYAVLGPGQGTDPRVILSDWVGFSDASFVVTARAKIQSLITDIREARRIAEELRDYFKGHWTEPHILPWEKKP